MDETSGTRYDSHNNNDLTDNNTVGYVSGVKGNAAYCVGANNEYLSIADNADISITGDFTISFWFNANTSITGLLFYKRGGEGNREYYSALNGITQWWVRLYPSSAYFENLNSATLSTGQWYYAVTYVNTTNDTFVTRINDSINNSIYYQYGIYDGTNPLWICDYWGGFTGYIDEFAIYKRVLTADEITWLYNRDPDRDANPQRHPYGNIHSHRDRDSNRYTNPQRYTNALGHA